MGVEDRPREAADYLSRAAKLQVRCKKFEESVESLQKSLNIYVGIGGNNAAAGRSAAGLVMVQLMRGDHIAAMRGYDTYGAFCDGETGQAMRYV